ncbi:helix-turn-helix transcriptional regulator [Alicyclobacillus cycloheptanicus]|uniref:Transcriptional regulator with XRE-family HTH domain n=1 Tax=Alicyclobacillus cycloheptanicus TaxID=1457 RepID=A0ABT9XIW3_9BACL|nr:helix-turn-helix transcriptional regulator [Alicyclobacillus cycloheptanicus]MDQ0189723.1 transcriptional regulator with XRE-family HTH domain [Alicyclobacillus cycloheptanicus]WDM01935.1 helix-turn-helix transcriptional regulator [Alicyclobacillus cycloheptanicus]
MASIAEKVRKLRAQRGWTLKQLSAYTRVSISHLDAIEKGTRKSPSFQIMVQLADAFEVPIAYFRDDVAVSDHPSAADHAVQAAPAPQTDTALQGDAALSRLYDADTRRFIVSEQARPYVALAKQLAEQSQSAPALDTSALLQVIAAFIRDRETSYES